ncbi:putative replicase protein [Chimpanzee associated porprismacovirus 1]|uniref:Replicase protein n=1 Tax=Chimpanzee stool associated circular ssDNA virus TaxID=702718 RepID=D2WKE3_9VIRU|nr:putative replicase protein [Chimpanzee associated porprismacovirus 1]ADB24797.1 putative replicase protein [Chimpanzee associated porprismacovirus 1]
MGHMFGYTCLKRGCPRRPLDYALVYGVGISGHNDNDGTHPHERRANPLVQNLPRSRYSQMGYRAGGRSRRVQALAGQMQCAGCERPAVDGLSTVRIRMGRGYLDSYRRSVRISTSTRRKRATIGHRGIRWAHVNSEFGKMRWNQEGALEALQRTNDREIVVWYDQDGNMGKSWLCGHLYETGKAYYIPPYISTIQSMIQTVASLVLQDREAGYPPRPLIVIDIPRSWKWSTELYTAIEAIKDGLIMDPRYGARPVNIHGTKVIVLTNTKPKLDKLSEDRWVLYDPLLYM